MVQYPMKYPASLLTSFLATLSQDVPLEYLFCPHF